jgi:uncharacterized protein
LWSKQCRNAPTHRWLLNGRCAPGLIMKGAQPQLSSNVALVTGAGAGTGREYAKLLLADGMKVIAVSLLKDELDDLACELDPGGEKLIIKQADLSQSDSAEELLQWCDARGYEVDVLINNAGFAVYGEPTQVELDRVEMMIGLNVVTALKLSVLFGRRMIKRRNGKILIMGSTAGFAPTPRLGAYCATKAFTNVFGWALAAELRAAGVGVTVVTPGSFTSKFASTAEVRDNSLLGKIYAHERLDAAKVAHKGYLAMRNGHPSVTVGLSGHIAKIVGRLLPPALAARVFHTM